MSPGREDPRDAGLPRTPGAWMVIAVVVAAVVSLVIQRATSPFLPGTASKFLSDVGLLFVVLWGITPRGVVTGPTKLLQMLGAALVGALVILLLSRVFVSAGA